MRVLEHRNPYTQHPNPYKRTLPTLFEPLDEGFDEGLLTPFEPLDENEPKPS